MLFTEPAFLFLFLPITLLTHWLTPVKWRNTLLAMISLIFYGLGEIGFVAWLVLSIAVNYVMALAIEHAGGERRRRWVLGIGIASDLILLLVFKYAGWLVSNLDAVLVRLQAKPLPIPAWALPLGISFFTFHKISYKIDVYRGVTRAQRNPITLGLYILFFPQLIAGPIVRYHDIADQLYSRVINDEDRIEGARRAILGLAKKVILANSVGVVADRVLDLPLSQMSCSAVWLGILCYTLQIYFDFSGYSDMAIGLARLFGFRFPENFDYPYSSLSVTEFWRRWHISLSRWFRDYLYVPLGGNRVSRRRTYFNLLLVFFLCGLWHGASWAFIVWGLFHGSFLVLERLGFERHLQRAPRPLRHAYTLLVVIVGWVFFRAGSLGNSLALLSAMAGSSAAVGNSASAYLDPWILTVLSIGVLGSFPMTVLVVRRFGLAHMDSRFIGAAPCLSAVGLGTLLLLSLTFIAAATYNPFLYFRF